MVWVEVAIWKFSVKITYFLLLYFVTSAIATMKILFKFKLSTKEVKIAQNLLFITFFRCGTETESFIQKKYF